MYFSCFDKELPRVIPCHLRSYRLMGNDKFGKGGISSPFIKRELEGF